MINLTLWLLYNIPRESSHYTLDRMLGGPPSQSECNDEEKNDKIC